MDEEQLRALIREEAAKLIREQLSVRMSERSEFYSDKLEIEILLDGEVVSSDFVTVSTRNGI